MLSFMYRNDFQLSFFTGTTNHEAYATHRILQKGGLIMNDTAEKASPASSVLNTCTSCVDKCEKRVK